MLVFGCASGPKVSSLNQVFAPFPYASLKQRPILPTDNESLAAGDYDHYVARTGINPIYGMPGWTRNQGSRFHEGIDIVPVSTVGSKQTVIASRKDAAGRVINRRETVRIPKDRVYAVLDGVVVVANANPARSGYGKYVMVEHTWTNGEKFLTLYGHLSAVAVRPGQAVSQGTALGIMGQTAADAASREYLKANPHCHFEVGRLIDPNTTDFAKYDPRNMQPYQPIEFLRHYDAIPRSVWAANNRQRLPLATVMPR